MSALVIDASLAASWLLPDETSPIADLARQALVDTPGAAPALWWFEIRNTLLMGERRNRWPRSTTEQVLRALTRLSISIDRDPDQAAIYAIARTQNLTVYDASYVELAQRIGGRLATLDRAMMSAAQAVGVAVLQPN